jgi:hypothetical protein
MSYFKPMCEFYFNVLLSEQGRGKVHWGSFWDGSGSQRKKGRVWYCMLRLDEKSPLFFFCISWGSLRGVEKGGTQIQLWHVADVASN